MVVVVVVVVVKPLPKESCDGLVVLWFLLLDGLGTGYLGSFCRSHSTGAVAGREC